MWNVRILKIPIRIKVRHDRRSYLGSTKSVDFVGEKNVASEERQDDIYLYIYIYMIYTNVNETFRGKGPIGTYQRYYQYHDPEKMGVVFHVFSVNCKNR